MTTTRVAITAIIVGLLLMLFATFAEGHSWYELECCDTRDCRPVSGIKPGGKPWSEIEDHGTYFVFKSSVTGVTHKIDKADADIRPSRDAFYHACEVTGESIVDSFVRCIYEPALF